LQAKSFKLELIGESCICPFRHGTCSCIPVCDRTGADFVTVIPELAVPDPDAARAMLRDVFGFVPDAGLMWLGKQAVAVTGGKPAGHGSIDHLALAVPDLDLATTELFARGARVDTAVTPHGPQEIAEFWGAGVRYLFMQGPAGARIELITNTAAPQGPGHDHIGIPCSDLAASAAFFMGLGAKELAAVTLYRPEGATPVRFLALQGSVLELYQPPQFSATAGPGLWRRLLITGVTPCTAPDDLIVAPA
jgi:catechol 2,3-dioxygenase-like lactoylglutathione lyase family enzyme